MTCLLKQSTPFALLFVLTATIVMFVQFHLVSSGGQTPLWHYPIAYIMVIIGYVHLNRSILASKILAKDALPIVIATLTTIIPVCSADILYHSAIFLSSSLALENLSLSFINPSLKSRLFTGSFCLSILIILLVPKFNIIPLLVFVVLIPLIGALDFKKVIIAYSGLVLPILACYYITWYFNLTNILAVDKLIYSVSVGEIFREFKNSAICFKDGISSALLSLLGIIIYLKKRKSIPLTPQRYITIYIIFYLVMIATVSCSVISYQSMILLSVPQIMFITLALEKIKDNLGTLLYYLLFLNFIAGIIIGFTR